jgi:hypothetical protein
MDNTTVKTTIYGILLGIAMILGWMFLGDILDVVFILRSHM